MMVTNREKFKIILISCLIALLVFSNTSIVMAAEDYDGYIYKEKGDDISEIQTADTLSEIYDETDAEDIEYIEPNYRIYLNDFAINPNDSYFSSQSWIFTMLNIQNVWANNCFGSYDGRTATVAVIDTGVSTHPDLSSILPGVRYVNGVKKEYTGDIDIHGTFVAGVISATNNNGIGISGAMPSTKIYPVTVFKPNKKGEIFADTNDLVKGINDAIEHGVDVINLSLGSYNVSTSEREVIKKAIDNNIIVVAASGNDGNRIRFYPASLENVVSVASVGKDGTRSSFSNHNNRVVVSAAGENIKSTVPVGYRNGNGYMSGSGTSFSAPYVSALAAMYKAIKPNGNATDFIEILKKTSTDKGSAGYDEYYGHGIVNFEKVYNYLLDKEYEEKELVLPKIKTFTLNKKGKKILVKWTRPSTELRSQITGYQITYASKKSFKGKKTVKISNASTAKKYIKNLNKGKRYYFKIRTYKGKKYSKWSKTKSLKL